MKKLILMICMMASTSMAFASETILTCTGHSGEGDQVQTVVLVKDGDMNKIIFNGISKPVIRVGESNVLSRKYVMESEGGEDLFSLVANIKTKQAALLYEVDLRGKVTTKEDNRYNVSVQFLDCK